MEGRAGHTHPAPNSLFFSSGCTVQAYGDLEDEISYLYPDEEELSEEEDQASHCTDTYYDRIAVHCWPKFHAAIMATAENKRCLWKTIGSMYGELAVCTGLLTESMGCPVSSPTLDAFFVRIHAEYFANCSLPTNTTDLQPSTGVVIVLASLPVCLVPLSVALAVCKA
ncbi:receptor activity-modifying protein 1-like [Elgaria multicarinata webbii]|uniref:receptor activity-modifying protein 1-like n=1 Tax=Elgaria multicarinata webbii TaxID=159646 RepID=UPI002FCCD7A9